MDINSTNVVSENKKNTNNLYLLKKNILTMSELQQIEIYSMLGNKVYSERFQARLKKLDVSFLASGSYILKVSSADQTGTYKLIKY